MLRLVLTLRDALRPLSSRLSQPELHFCLFLLILIVVDLEAELHGASILALRLLKSHHFFGMEALRAIGMGFKTSLDLLMLTLLKLRRLYVAKGATFELTKRLGVQRICLLWLRSNRLLLDFDRDIDLVLVILARLALHPKVVLLLL